MKHKVLSNKNKRAVLSVKVEVKSWTEERVDLTTIDITSLIGSLFWDRVVFEPSWLFFHGWVFVGNNY